MWPHNTLFTVRYKSLCNSILQIIAKVNNLKLYISYPKMNVSSEIAKTNAASNGQDSRGSIPEWASEADSHPNSNIHRAESCGAGGEREGQMPDAEKSPQFRPEALDRQVLHHGPAAGGILPV